MVSGCRCRAEKQRDRRESSDRRGHRQRFKLAVQFFPMLVCAVELSFGFGILDSELLEPLSLTVDTRDGNSVAQLVEPLFQSADRPFCRHQLLLKPRLAQLPRSPRGGGLRGELRHPDGFWLSRYWFWRTDLRFLPRGIAVISEVLREPNLRDVPDPGCYPVDEESVVRNEDDRPVIGGEHLL